MEKNEKNQNNLEKIYNDIARAAEIAGVPYNPNVIRKILQSYKDFLNGSPVTFVTNTRPPDARNLSVRYVTLKNLYDPFQIALEKGFLTIGDHPIYELLVEIRSHFPIMGSGIDLDVAHGLSKIWSFVIPQPVEKVLQINTVPNSVKDYFPYYYRHNLEVFHLFSLDYLSKSVNIYFIMKEPGQLTIQHIIDMLNGLDFQVPPVELLNYCTRAQIIYPTFNWDSEDITRLCFSIVAHGRQEVPIHLDPLLDIYTQGAPFLSEEKRFIYSLTFERRNHYLKIENDYTGNMIDLIKSNIKV